jgi:hypothetical protein
MFNNKEVREMASLIIEMHLDFRKGTVGGYSMSLSSLSRRVFCSGVTEPMVISDP